MRKRLPPSPRKKKFGNAEKKKKNPKGNFFFLTFFLNVVFGRSFKSEPRSRFFFFLFIPSSEEQPGFRSEPDVGIYSKHVILLYVTRSVEPAYRAGVIISTMLSQCHDDTTNNRRVVTIICTIVGVLLYSHITFAIR